MEPELGGSRRKTPVNWSHVLSLSRIVALPVIVALIYSSWTWAPFIAGCLFGGAAITDVLDGRLARRRGTVSPLGVFLDLAADKILIIGILIAMVDEHWVPGWMVIVIVTREFLVSGLRTVAASGGVIIPAGRWGKGKTLVTILAMETVFGREDVHRGGAWAFGQGNAVEGFYNLAPWFMLLATIWTVASGLEYLVAGQRALRAHRRASTPERTVPLVKEPRL